MFAEKWLRCLKASAPLSRPNHRWSSAQFPSLACGSFMSEICSFKMHASKPTKPLTKQISIIASSDDTGAIAGLTAYCPEVDKAAVGTRQIGNVSGESLEETRVVKVGAKGPRQIPRLWRGTQIDHRT